MKIKNDMNDFFNKQKEKSDKKNLIYYCGILDPGKLVSLEDIRKYMH